VWEHSNNEARDPRTSLRNRRPHVQIPFDLIITVGGLCAALGAGLGLGVLLGRYVWPHATRVDPATMAAKIDIARLEDECSALQSRASDLDIRCRSAADDARKAGEDVARLTARMAGLTALAELEPRHHAAASEAGSVFAEAARLTNGGNTPVETMGGQAFLDAPRLPMAQPESRQRRALKTRGTAAPSNSRELIDAIAAPLRPRVQASRKKVEARRSQRKPARVSRSKSRGK
jgi:hypothetical protein